MSHHHHHLPPLSPLDNFLPNFWSLPSPQSPFTTHHVFPPSPSDTCSSFSSDFSPSPPPDTVRVVCNVPLIAPRPLPYHSPTFLQFDLPDTDEDLSHPPYTHRPAKRKRGTHDDPVVSQPQSKRRPGIHRWRSRPSRPSHRPAGNPSPVTLFHPSANRP